MFCFQCEQTAGCSGCTGNSGVCGKTADTAKLQDELTGALIGLARAVDSTTAVSKKTSQVIIEGLFTTVTNVNFEKKKGWLLIAANVSLRVVKQTNTICSNYGMQMKISDL